MYDEFGSEHYGIYDTVGGAVAADIRAGRSTLDAVVERNGAGWCRRAFAEACAADMLAQLDSRDALAALDAVTLQQQPLLDDAALAGIARSYYNGARSASQLLRAHGLDRLRVSINRCQSVNYLWLLTELEAAQVEKSQRQKVRAEIAHAVYQQRSLNPIVEQYGARAVAVELRWLRGDSDATRSRGYPDPAVAYTIAAEMAIADVSETSNH